MPTATPAYNASQIINIAKELPPQIALLIKGETGVGKSAITRQIGSLLDLPVIDIRLSLRNEGDMIGLPDQGASSKRGVTCFAPPAWLMRACSEPVVLFLDEFNRAEKQVQNAAFQLVLDRSLGENPDGEPYELHPETRIVAAINEGYEYIGVEDMDAALVRRFFACEFAASFADWRKWALSENEDGETRVDRGIVEFLSENTDHWNADLSKVEPGSVFPTPATWHRLSDTFRYMGAAPSENLGQKMASVAYHVSCTAVGTTASAALRNWVESAVQSVRAEEIFDPSLKKKERNKLLAIVKRSGVEAQITVANQVKAEKGGLADWIKEGRLTPSQAIDIMEEFVVCLNHELQAGCGTHLLKAIASTKKHHGVSGKEFQEVIKRSTSLQSRCVKRASAD